MSELSYNHDPDNSCITIMLDGKEVVTWVCAGGDPEVEFSDFKKVYAAGKESASNVITTEKAMNHLRKAFADDPEYAYGWHANIAMSCVDAMMTQKDRVPMDSYSDFHYAANDGASRFMKVCFDTETSLHMLED